MTPPVFRMTCESRVPERAETPPFSGQAVYIKQARMVGSIGICSVGTPNIYLPAGVSLRSLNRQMLVRRWSMQSSSVREWPVSVEGVGLSHISRVVHGQVDWADVSAASFVFGGGSEALWPM